MTSHETISIYSTNDSIYFPKRLQIYRFINVYILGQIPIFLASREGFVQNSRLSTTKQQLQNENQIPPDHSRDLGPRIYSNTAFRMQSPLEHAYFAWLRSENVRSRHSRPPSRHYERTKGETSRDINASLCFVSLRYR